jgi:hypothetical protein
MKNQTINITFLNTTLEVEYYIENNQDDHYRDIEQLNIEFVRVGGICITDIMDKHTEELIIAVYEAIERFND